MSSDNEVGNTRIEESMSIEIILYGAQRCSKTRFYQDWLKEHHCAFTFKDVEQSKEAEVELRALYDTGRLNFPTLMIGDKKLRNPSESTLQKWLSKAKDTDTKTRTSKEAKHND